MKNIQLNRLFPVLFISILVIAACSSEPKTELFGFWVVEDVQADVDTSQISPEVLERALDVYRSINFEFRENDSMNLISEGGVHPGTWNYKEDEAAIYMKMAGTSAPDLIKFADYKDGKLINTNETRIGKIVVIYIKQ